METLLQEDDKSNNNPAENSIFSYDYIIDTNKKKVTTVANKYSNGQTQQETVGEEMFDFSVYQGTRPSINTDDTIAAYNSAANFAGDTAKVTARIIDTIAEETASVVDNVPGYINKYKTLINPIPDNENVWFNLNNSGKGPVRNAWDYYRSFGGIFNNSFAAQQLEEESTGELIAEVGSELVPWLYGINIIKAPAKVQKYGRWATELYKWGVAGFATDFVYGNMDTKSSIPFINTVPTEAAGKLMQTIGFDPKDEPMIKTLLHHSFLDGDDAEMFANKLDHAVNAGIVDGTLGVLFAGIGNVYRNGVAKFFPEYATAQYFAKPLARDHGTKFEKFKKNFDTTEEAMYKYFAQPELKTWMMNQHINGRTFGVLSKSFDRKYNQFLQSLKTKAGYGDVLGPMQLGSGSRYTAPTQGSYDFAKQNLLNVYKFMQKHKNPLKLFLGGGAAFTTMFGTTNAEAGVLDKVVQKVFEKGGQRLFTRGANNKLIPMTHDDVLNMPLDKEVIIQPMDAESNWIVHENKDVYLQSDDGYAANPLDLLPNQKYPYYDALSEKIRGMNFKSMPKEQFLNTITNTPGIKKDEIETTELVEFVNSVEGDKITKQDLLTNWYDSSRIKLKTRLMGSDNGSGEMEEAYGRYENYITPGDYDKYKEHLITFERRDTPQLLEEFERRKFKLEDVSFQIDNYDGSYVVRRDGTAKVVSEGSMINSIAGPIVDKIKQDTGLERSQIINNPKYETIIAEGMLEKINEEIMFEAREELGTSFKSGHFGPKDILAHTRSTERNINGTPSFFIEEVQSDMHQIGMKQGYRNTEEFLKLKQRHQELIGEENKLLMRFNTGAKDLTVGDELLNVKTEFKNVSNQLFEYNKRIPDAPFKNEKDWVSLSLKEMVNFAAKKGYNQIAWTSGRLQNERYNIGQYVDELKVTTGDDADSVFLQGIGEDKDIGSSYEIFEKNIALAQLDETVGKPLATKIRAGMENAPDEFKKFGLKFSGLDLNLAGEGKTLQRFYDNLIPSLLKKMYEKDGVEFGTTSLETAIEAQPAPYEEMSEELYNDAYEKVYITQLDNEQIKEEGLAIVEGYDVWGLKVNDEFVDVQSFEMNDNRQLEAPLYQNKKISVTQNEPNQTLVPPRLEGTTYDRALDYFQDSESEAIEEAMNAGYDEYVRDFKKNTSSEDSVERNILFMTIPENLKDRVLKLGQPLFGSNPSKLGAYENKTTQ